MGPTSLLHQAFSCPENPDDGHSKGHSGKWIENQEAGESANEHATT